MKTIYLEVDNVLIKNGKTSPHIKPFIEYIKRRFDVYFLTRISQNDIEKILEHIDQKTDDKELLPLLEDIEVKEWSDVRADGLDPSKNYIWYNGFDFDEEEEKYLTNNNLGFGRKVTDEENFFIKELEIYEKFRIDKLSPAYYFIQNTGTNLKGETYDDVLEYDNDKMEDDHEYIQWIFPTNRPSEAVEEAPCLSDEEVEELKGNKVVIYNLLEGVVRMRQFYNYNRLWLREYDHNHLRITRIITSLKLLIGKEEARDFYSFIMDKIQDEKVNINEDSLDYWEKATQ